MIIIKENIFQQLQISIISTIIQLTPVVIRRG